MTRLLVVDDEPHLLRALVLNLTHRGYEVTTATTAALALAHIRRLPPDLLVLDLRLPDLDGLDVIRELRDNGPTVPILVLSARSGSQDKIAALDLGAVDYVTKPFDMNELIVRLRSAIHRSGIESDALQVTLGNVDIDLSARTARRAALCDEWRRWDPGLQLRVLPSPHRNLVAPVVGYVRSQLATGREVTVLLAEVQPRKRRQRILHNQRGLILAAALRSRTDAVVATVSYRLR